MWEMWIEIEMALQIDLAKLMVESDSKTLVDMQLKEDRDVKDTLTIVKRMQWLLAGDCEVEIMYHSGNKVYLEGMEWLHKFTSELQFSNRHHKHIFPKRVSWRSPF